MMIEIQSKRVMYLSALGPSGI